MKNKLSAYIKNCSIIWKRPEIAKQYLSLFEGKPVGVVVQNIEKEPTNEQYGYLFGVVLDELAKHTGYTKNQVLALMKSMFHFEVIEINGNIYKVNKSISKKKSDVHILSKLIDNIVMWAASEGYLISEAKSDKNDGWVKNMAESQGEEK